MFITVNDRPLNLFSVMYHYTRDIKNDDGTISYNMYYRLTDGRILEEPFADIASRQAKIDAITKATVGGGSSGSSMKEYKSAKQLAITIDAIKEIDIPDLTPDASKAELEQLVYDINGTVGRITEVDSTNNKVKVQTITIAGSGSGTLISNDFEYEEGYSYEVVTSGTGYTVGDIVPTDIANVFAKVSEVDTNGEILSATYTRKIVSSTSGTGADLKATKDSNVFVVPDTNWNPSLGILTLTNPDGAPTEFIKTGDVTTKYAIGAQSRYYKFVYDEDEGCITQSYSVIQGGGDSKLLRDVKANVSAGAINVNDVVKKDTTFTEFVEKLLIKQINPTVTFTATSSGVKEVGTSVTNPTLTLKVTSVGTSTPTSIKFFEGSTLLGSVPYVAGQTQYTYNYSGSVSNTSTFKGTLSYEQPDGSIGAVSASAYYTFVYASYIGAVSTLTPSDTDILALNKNVKNTKAYTYNNITLGDERICYAYPASFGNLTSIKDANNFEYLGSYTKSTMLINSENYVVYILTDPITVTGFKQIYA